MTMKVFSSACEAKESNPSWVPWNPIAGFLKPSRSGFHGTQLAGFHRTQFAGFRRTQFAGFGGRREEEKERKKKKKERKKMDRKRGRRCIKKGDRGIKNEESLVEAGVSPLLGTLGGQDRGSIKEKIKDFNYLKLGFVFP
ncbi:hypothetical protein SLEP1_g47521 [Rubroshorea leprosula]|uniref:Uncharacterized protein n=1 Tax=Rubroshorea leprosula TaxID=152421 RepID=A0AAV5LSH5_9ROSI|nr:hypothetical protein SLEP1_g47521 [Rubroshorea leprosula]